MPADASAAAASPSRQTDWSLGATLTDARPTVARHSPLPERDPEAWKVYIGSNGRAYYDAVFGRLAADERARWHWPALFTTFFWLLYRKMWRNALFYVVFVFAALAIFGAVERLGQPAFGLLSLGALLAVVLVPPLQANQWYWNHAMATMRRAREASRTREQYLLALESKGGATLLPLLVVFGLWFGSGVLAAVALPAYQDYTNRVKLAEVAGVGDRLARGVVEFYVRNNRMPPGVEHLGHNQVIPLIVRGTTISPQDGTVTMALGDMGTLQFRPHLQKDGGVTVHCWSANIRQQWLPGSCR